MKKTNWKKEMVIISVILTVGFLLDSWLKQWGEYRILMTSCAALIGVGLGRLADNLREKGRNKE